MLERSFKELSEQEIEYFKENIFKCYLDNRVNIRKTISNLINTFIQTGGIDAWPQVFDILYLNLNDDIGVSMSLETINFILEDSGSVIELKFKEV